MKNVIFSLCLLCISSASLAANWVEVADGVNGAKYYIDMGSIKYSPKQNTTTAWVKGENYYKAPTNPYSKEKGEASYKSKNIYYCESQQYKQLYTATYDIDGVNLMTLSKPSEIFEIVPDSVAETIYQKACRK